MFTNYEVAKRFAEGKGKGKSLHMFIDGASIFSYGRHFEIARRLEGGVVWFTTRGYSRSTARHKSLVLKALHGMWKIEHKEL